ncbi:MAG: exodeoxyribonuclease VII large subunit [Candidatus Omnitrophica bacterium]|nr:exodeoxyribonuclease VII large subunit [Candidatus Omnitrophota bacterium]
MADEFFSVSELNNFIKDVINAGFPQMVWVCGEIQSYDRNKNKSHVFFELVEKDKQSHDVTARIGLVIFAGRRSYIEAVLKKSENGFALKDDIEVKFACRVDFYPPHGAVRLIVEDIDPVYTLGKMAQEKQRLIALLKQQGVLDRNKRLDLPLVPLNLGLITAYDSAAYHDFVSELKKSGYGFTIYLRDALMQGKKAESDVAAAIDDLEKIAAVEAIVITRGGGSIADLSCFDSRLIAEKIAGCRCPVLSGIGHEINTTIADLASHTFAKTPTAIAQFLAGRVSEFAARVDQLRDGLVVALGEIFKGQRLVLRENARGLQDGATRYFKAQQVQLAQFSEQVRQKPVLRLRDCRRRIAERQAGVAQVLERRLAKAKQALTHYEKLVQIAHPKHILQRGFSITRGENGQLIRRTKDIHAGKTIVTEVLDGEFTSRVA